MHLQYCRRPTGQTADATVGLYNQRRWQKADKVSFLRNVCQHNVPSCQMLCTSVQSVPSVLSGDLQNIVTLQQQQDLITVSEFAHIAINKMHLFSFSVVYACYYSNLTATTGYHSVHNADIGKLLAHTTPYSSSAICPVRWNPSIHAENVSPKCQMHGAQSTSWCDCQAPGELSWNHFNQLVLETQMTLQTNCCISCPAGWSQANYAGEEVGCGAPGLSSIHLQSLTQSDVMPNSLKKNKQIGDDVKLTLDSQAAALVMIPADRSHAPSKHLWCCC